MWQRTYDRLAAKLDRMADESEALMNAKLIPLLTRLGEWPPR